MSGLPLELGRVVLNTTIVYLFLILSLSLLGHRETSQLGPVEIVIIMVLGSSVETAMVAGDTSLLAGLTAAATLFALNWGLTRLLRRWHWLHRIIIGHPVTLVYNGKLLVKRVQAAGLSPDDVLEGIRERGYDAFSQVRFAVLETDGTISVVPQDAASGRKAPAKAG
jgi:uncharacterized membrane protein YcaP (DUF421 family)